MSRRNPKSQSTHRSKAGRSSASAKRNVGAPASTSSSGRSRAKKSTPSTRTNVAKVKAFSAINRVRKGQSRTLSAAARAERTSVRTIRRLLPAALIQDRSGRRIRVKAGDPYSWPVEIVTDDGPVEAKARGSRERDLAGQHRAVWIQVLGKKLPVSALEQFRGKKVGGQELLSDFDRLSLLANAGVLGQLTILYKSPETGA